MSSLIISIILLLVSLVFFATVLCVVYKRKETNEMYFVHKKTGHVYTLLYKSVIDATNSRDGTTVCVYMNISGEIFVREEQEFYEKFESLEDVNCKYNHFLSKNERLLDKEKYIAQNSHLSISYLDERMKGYDDGYIAGYVNGCKSKDEQS